MSMDEDCCVRAADDAADNAWDEGARYMLRSVAELIGNGKYDSANVWAWISKEMKQRGYGTWETDRGIIGFHQRIDEK